MVEANTRFGRQHKDGSDQVRPLVIQGAPVSIDASYIGELATYFYSLTVIRRGDSARGRGVQVLYFLNYVWSVPKMPLYDYRPYRNSASFLAMAFDLCLDVAKRHTELTLEGQQGFVEASLRACLSMSWADFCISLKTLGLDVFARVLKDTIRSTLFNTASSNMPGELKRLDLYMTPGELAHFDREVFIDHLPVYQVLSYLRFRPPTLWEVKREQHPVGGDLRTQIRERYDWLWARVAAETQAPDMIALFALLPVDSSALFANSYAFQDEDFAVFYACLTNSRRPGRQWSPPLAYTGETAEDRAHFRFLTAGDKRDGYLRKSQILKRIGLSSTFPETVRLFDTWLEDTERFTAIHNRALWQQTLHHYRTDIARERQTFFKRLVEVATGGYL